MSIFKKIEQGLRKVKDKIVDDIIPTGSAAKRAIRKAIPNELADIAVDLAPFVAPFNPALAAGMRGIGRFDQRGSISDALKQGAMMYGGGKLVGMIPGTESYFGQGLEGAKALGSDALSGIRNLGTSGKNSVTEMLGGGKNAASEVMGNMYPTDYGYELGSGAASSGGGIKSLGSKILDFGKEYAFGEDKKFQMGDIGKFLGDPGKTVPLTMIASYIKEKFFPDEDQDSFDAQFAEAMKKRGENVAGYLRQYGPFDPRRDPTKNPYTQQEIDQFAKDKTIEYENAANGGLMSIPRENYFLGSKPFTAYLKAEPGSPGASKEVTADDILNVFKTKFDEGNFFKGRILPKGVTAGTYTAQPQNTGGSSAEPEDIMKIFENKMGNSSNPFLKALKQFSPDGGSKKISDKEGLGKLMVSLLRQANFDREEAAMGGRMNYASGSGELPSDPTKPINPFAPKPTGPALPNKMMAGFGTDKEVIWEMRRDSLSFEMFNKDYEDLNDDEKETIEIQLDMQLGKKETAPQGPALPNKMMASMEENELEFMRLVDEFMEQGFNLEEAIEAAREELERKSIATGGRVNYAMGGDTPEENALQAAGIEGLDININPKGITELDMRETGGFIPPVGVKEKEDDIPAMLSNNEFVFTADAVKGMGDGDVDKGAERMYDMMKKLENGGRV